MIQLSFKDAGCRKKEGQLFFLIPQCTHVTEILKPGADTKTNSFPHMKKLYLSVRYDNLTCLVELISFSPLSHVTHAHMCLIEYTHQELLKIDSIFA